MSPKINLELKAKIILMFGCQANFAQELDIDEGLVSRVIRGRKKLAPEQQIEWSNRLHCKPEEIFQA